MDIAEVIPNAFQTSCETLEANWGPRSDMILSGSPNRFHAFSRNSLAVSDAVIVFLHGDITIALENLSTITLIESNPLISGRSVMKSVVTCSQGPLGVSVGMRGALVGWVRFLVDWQTAQPSTYALEKLDIPGHQ